MSSVTHVAGPPVNINGRVIQRCVVCGEKLCDSLNTSAPLNPDGTPPIFPTWGERSFVQTDGNRQSFTGVFGKGRIPDDFCLELVEQ